MDSPERHVLQAFTLPLSDQVDPLKIAQCLKKLKVINNNQRMILIDLNKISRKKAWQYLLSFVDEHLLFQQLLKALLTCSYNELFMQILSQFQCLKSEISNTKSISSLKRTSGLEESRRFSQDLFTDMKIKTHDVSIGNPRKYLRERSEMYWLEFNSEEEGLQKMMKADKYAASLCAELDSHTMLLSPHFPTHGLFEKLKELIPYTSNTCITQVAHDCRLANVMAITGNVEKGDDFLQSAMLSSLGIGHCVELVNMLYVQVFNLMYVFEQNPTYFTLDKIIKITEYSLHCVSEERNDLIRVFWMRMFYLRVTFCLLGISNNCTIIPGFVVLHKYIKKAQTFIAEVDKMWSGIEARRKMFYYVAQARLYELEDTPDDIELAIEYVNMAIDMGVKGSFSETVSIQQYARDLHRRSGTSPESPSCDILTSNLQQELTIDSSIGLQQISLHKIAVEHCDVEHHDTELKLGVHKIPVENEEDTTLKCVPMDKTSDDWCGITDDECSTTGSELNIKNITETKNIESLGVEASKASIELDTTKIKICYP